MPQGESKVTPAQSQQRAGGLLLPLPVPAERLPDAAACTVCSEAGAKHFPRYVESVCCLKQTCIFAGATGQQTKVYREKSQYDDTRPASANREGGFKEAWANKSREVNILVRCRVAKRLSCIMPKINEMML